MRIWTYKNADEKAHTFSRSKNVKKRTKTYEKRILRKFTFMLTIYDFVIEIIISKLNSVKCTYSKRLSAELSTQQATSLHSVLSMHLLNHHLPASLLLKLQWT